MPSLFHHWITSLFLFFLFELKMIDSQNSYLTPYGTYLDDYPVETKGHVKYNVPETYYSRPLDNSNFKNHFPRENDLNLPSYSSNYDYLSHSQDILNQKLHSNEKDENNNWVDKETLGKMYLLEKLLSDESEEKDLETKNSLNDKIIMDSIMPEDTKRVVRQVSKQKPGFFWTLARITFETFNDTTSAIKQIGSIISNSIRPDTTTIKSINNDSLMASNKILNDQNEITMTTGTTTTSTEGPVLTKSLLQSLIVRNIKGLIRLFNIEWKDAITQSSINANEFRKNLGKQVGKYLQDNPKAY